MAGAAWKTAWERWRCIPVVPLEWVPAPPLGASSLSRWGREGSWERKRRRRGFCAQGISNSSEEMRLAFKRRHQRHRMARPQMPDGLGHHLCCRRGRGKDNSGAVGIQEGRRGTATWAAPWKTDRVSLGLGAGFLSREAGDRAEYIRCAL